MISVYGAGAVGLVIGARLARAGVPTLFITRREEVAKQISEEGVRVEDPSTGNGWSVRVPAVAGAAAAADRIGRGPVLLLTRGSDVEQAADELVRHGPDATVVCFQNDVHNEAKLEGRFPLLLSGVVRQTSTRTSDHSAVAVGNGRLVVGLHPSGSNPAVGELARALRSAGYDVGVSERIREDKWLKLCINLTSAPNALVVRRDHTTQAFVDVKVRLLEEASRALSAAGIAASSCDGRDRSLAEEIAFHRGSLAAGTSARRLPIYNQVWAALRHGGPLEADLYHQRILDLSARADLDAPVNASVLRALLRAYREGSGPECISAASLLPGAQASD